jgi:peptidyl-prolyl cis-trans isomerase SurA
MNLKRTENKYSRMKRIIGLIVLACLPGVFLPGIQAQGVRDSIVDGVVAVVGANAILKSDIENQYLQFRQQGAITGTATDVKCQIFEHLLYQKLLLHQAQVDSVKVTDSQVESEMDRRMRFYINVAGSPERLEENFQKSIPEIKNELRDIIKEQLLAQQVEQKIIANVTITPEEVKAFFKKMPKDSIPEINSEMEVGIIVKQPVIGEAEKQEVKNKLKGFKERIQKGDDFSTLAVLYSEDPGSAKKGGELGLFKRGEMRAEFEAAAFRLKPGEVSDIVETEDGFHLIQMIERRGEYINVRHILLQPKVSLVNLTRAKLLLDSVADQIVKKKLTFENAVAMFSDDPSRNNGGMMINPNTNNSRFEADQLDPKVFFVIDKMKVGEISASILFKTERGRDEYRLYYLKTRTNPHKANLDQDYARIQDVALEKKKTRTIEKWTTEKITTSYVKINYNYLGCKFQRNWQHDNSIIKK